MDLSAGTGHQNDRRNKLGQVNRLQYLWMKLYLIFLNDRASCRIKKRSYSTVESLQNSQPTSIETLRNIEIKSAGLILQTCPYV